jgi:hypothetical protein
VLSKTSRAGRRKGVGLMLPVLELTHDLVGDVGWFVADIDGPY